MAHPRPFRFGVQVSTAPDGPAWAALARSAEDLGYSTLFVPDHFGDQLAPVPALMAAADATTSLRVGTLVWDNDYKHPVVLAKEVATLDVLSGGRLEFGLGAGWMNTDYEQSGIPHDKPSVRIARMEEAITVYKGLFAPGPFTHKGEHYAITGLDALPKPLQQPHPPLIIGGGGRKVLTVAGREADIVGIAPSAVNGAVDLDAARTAAADATDQKLAWVKEAAGDRYGNIELNVLLFGVAVTDDRATMQHDLAPLFGITPAELAASPHVAVGTIEQIIEDLQERRDRWDLSYVTVQADALESFAPVVAALAGT